MTAPAAPPSRPVPVYHRQWFQLTLGLLVTAGCLAWAFYSMAGKDNPAQVWSQIRDAFSRADYRTLPVIIGAVIVFYLLKAWRWTLLLQPLGQYSIRQTFPPTLIGFAFNNLLPAHLGEFVRVFVFARQHRLPKTAVLSTVVLERIFDILAILGFFFVGLAFTPGLPDDLQRMAWIFAGFVATALCGAGVYLIWTQPFVRLVEAVLAKLPFLPASLRDKVCRMLEGGATGLASLRSGGLVFHISWTSIAQWTLNGLMMYVSLWAFDIRVSPMAAFLLLGVVAFGVTIPSSPGYFGVVQALFLVVLKSIGVQDQPAVFAASIYFHMSQYVLVTSLGLFYFNRTGLSVSQVQHAAEEEQQTTSAAPA